jgi:hypothetical protein
MIAPRTANSRRSRPAQGSGEDSQSFNAPIVSPWTIDLRTKKGYM